MESEISVLPQFSMLPPAEIEELSLSLSLSLSLRYKVARFGSSFANCVTKQ